MLAGYERKRDGPMVGPGKAELPFYSISVLRLSILSFILIIFPIFYSIRSFIFSDFLFYFILSFILSSILSILYLPCNLFFFIKEIIRILLNPMSGSTFVSNLKLNLNWITTCAYKDKYTCRHFLLSVIVIHNIILLFHPNLFIVTDACMSVSHSKSLEENNSNVLELYNEKNRLENKQKDKCNYNRNSYVVTYNNILLPKLGFGTAGLGHEKSYSSTYYALTKGFQLIDSAQAKEWYIEEEVGRAFQDYIYQRINTINVNDKSDGDRKEEEEFTQSIKYKNIRKDYRIVSKLHPRDFGYHKAIRSIESTLKAFGTDYIDVFLLHSPSCWPEANEEAPTSCVNQMEKNTWIDAYKGLEELYRIGKVKSIGVSNFDLHLLEYLVEEIAEIKPMVVQNWFDPFHRDEEVRKFCVFHQIIYMAYSTLGTQWPYQVIQGTTIDVNPILTNDVHKEILSEEKAKSQINHRKEAAT